MPIFWMILKVACFFQMQMVTPHAVNFVRQTYFCLGGGVPKIPLKRIAQNQLFLVQKPLLIYFSPFWSIYGLFGPFLTLFEPYLKKHHF